MECLRCLSRALLAITALEACTLDVNGSGTANDLADLGQERGEARGSDVVVEASDGAESEGLVSRDAAMTDDDDAAIAEDDVSTSDDPEGPVSDDAGVRPSSSTIRVVDGVSAHGEWDDATWARPSSATNPSNWGADRNELRALAVAVDEDFLWMRVEGVIEVTNAIAVYLDSVPSAGISPSALTDRLGMVDDAISCGVSSPADHAPDFAWGTRAMDQGPLVPAPGWRALTSPSDLAWIPDQDAPSVCAQNVCETRIARSTIGSGPWFVFARLMNATGDLLSNQALPVQHGAAADKVTEVMLVTAH